MRANCIDCGFFRNDPVMIETAFPGLNSLSSAYSSVRAESGICDRLDLFVSSRYGCTFFVQADNSQPEKA
ncbi:MAG: hypothetical protein ABSA46_18880 [Thermodesulfovibrionales bacterium]